MDSVVHFEIPAESIERAKRFYQNVFGWKITSVPEMNYNMAGTTEVGEDRRPKEVGAINGGMMARSDLVKSPVVFMMVENIDESLKKVEKNGGKRIQEKQKVGDMGWSVYAKDSEGNVIGLFQAAPR